MREQGQNFLQQAARGNKRLIIHLSKGKKIVQTGRKRERRRKFQLTFVKATPLDNVVGMQQNMANPVI